MAERFGDVLARARKEKKITLRKLSQLVNFSPSFLSELENSRRSPPREKEKILDLAIVLDINPQKLLEAAKMERVRKSPKIFEKLFDSDQNLAWGFFREAENASDDELQMAFRTALETLKNNRRD